VLDHIFIAGGSNFTDYKLTYTNKGYLIHNETNANTVSFKIPINEITAPNVFMLSNFRELIQAKQYPYIDISVSKNQVASIINGDQISKITVTIGITDKTNIYIIPFFVGSLPNKDKYIMGNACLYLSDYNIKPYPKIFGLLKIRDEVFINFMIKFKVV